MSRIVLATSGSFGDLHPYLAIGLGLKNRGYDVTIASAGTYHAKVTGEGLRFHAIRPDIAPSLYDRDVFRHANDLRNGAQYLIKELVLPHIAEMYDDLLDVCDGADLLLIHPILFAAPVAAEKLKLKWMSVALAPSTFVSVYDPPVLPPFPWLHHLRHFGPWPTRLVFELFRKITRPWMRPVDDLRRRVGVPPAERHPLQDGMMSPFGTLACFSSIFGKPQPDWPVNTQITGFPFYDRRAPHEHMEPDLREFLERGEPPVVFTLGSSAVIDPGSFYRDSFEAIAQLGRRAVFLTGGDPANRPLGQLHPAVFFSEYAPYSELFPKCAAVVHQGGVGTIAQGLRAGVPMLVVPFMHDQPDNAFRVQRLGVARVLARHSYNSEGAAAELNTLLNDRRYASNAQAAAAQILAEDGVAQACQAIESVVNDGTESCSVAGLASMDPQRP